MKLSISTSNLTKSLVFFVLFLGLSCNNSKESDGDAVENEDDIISITVNTEKTIASNVDQKIGFNLNAGIDNDINRPTGAKPFASALQELGVKHLRFPGGKKSLYYIWSEDGTDPNTASWVPNEYYGTVSKNTINFDEFMALCNQIGAEPHINVAYNPAAGLDEELAANWVKYANVTNNYNIEYWEIGNEMWQDELALTASSLADIVQTYSQAMKAIDPTIKIGVSWKNEQEVINLSNGALDYIAFSNYLSTLPNTENYNDYAMASNVEFEQG